MALCYGSPSRRMHWAKLTWPYLLIFPLAPFSFPRAATCSLLSLPVCLCAFWELMRRRGAVRGVSVHSCSLPLFPLTPCPPPGSGASGGDAASCLGGGGGWRSGAQLHLIQNDCHASLSVLHLLEPPFWAPGRDVASPSLLFLPRFFFQISVPAACQKSPLLLLVLASPYIFILPLWTIGNLLLQARWSSGQGPSARSCSGRV